MRLKINPKYEALRPFVEQLRDPKFFASHGEMLHNGRNILKKMDFNGYSVVVKSYNKLSIINRMIYGILRKSKATRAFLYTDRMRKLGIDAPEEVAAVEVRSRGLMRQCYYVSLYSDYQSCRAVTDNFLLHKETQYILDDLVLFLCKMHDGGVLHNDLNIDNILYKIDASGRCHFQIIDFNRTSFRRKLSLQQRLDNLRRLSCSAPAYLYILQRYAELQHTDTEILTLNGAVRRLIFEGRQRMKRTTKAFFRGFRQFHAHKG